MSIDNNEEDLLLCAGIQEMFGMAVRAAPEEEQDAMCYAAAVLMARLAHRLEVEPKAVFELIERESAGITDEQALEVKARVKAAAAIAKAQLGLGGGV